jgi:O-antigen/teichoic acid export membrane protein
MTAVGRAYGAERRSVVRGSLWGTVGWAAAFLVGPPVTIGLVRVMSHRQYGLFALATAIVGPATALAALGLGPALSQIAAAERARTGDPGMLAVLRSGSRLSWRATRWVALGCAALVGVVAVSATLRPALLPLLVMLPTVVIAAYRGLCDGFLRAADRASWYGAGMAVSAIGTGLVVLPMIVAGHPSALLVAWAWLVGPVAGLVVSRAGVQGWVRARPPAAPGLEIAPANWFGLSFAMLLAGVSWLLIAQLDVLVLGLDRGAAAAGVYAPVSRMAELSLAIAGILGTFLLPTMAASVARGESAKTTYLYHWASRWSIVAALPLLAVMVLEPAPLLRLCFGDGFGGVAGPARLLGIAGMVHISFGFNGWALEAHGVAMPTAIRSGVGILVSVVVCLVLVPREGATGAAIATLAAIATVNVLCSTALWQRFRIAPWDLAFALVLVAGAAGLAVAVPVGRAVSGDAARCVLVAATAMAVVGLANLAVHRLELRQGL